MFYAALVLLHDATAQFYMLCCQFRKLGLWPSNPAKVPFAGPCLASGRICRPGDESTNPRNIGQLFDATIIGETPSKSCWKTVLWRKLQAKNCPNLAWFGVWCKQDTEGRFRDDAETDKLAEIESDLLKLASKFSNGWAVYVRCAKSAGRREYFFYYGGNAALHEMLKPLQNLHPEYRIGYDSQPRNGRSTPPG